MRQKNNCTTIKTTFFAIFSLFIGILIGILVGYLIMRDNATEEKEKKMMAMINEDTWQTKPEIRQKLIDMMDRQNIKDNLRELSKEPHVAGTPRDEEMAQQIKNTWIAHGLDSADLVPYDILLSHPHPKKPNIIEILGPSNQVYLDIVPREPPLRPEDYSENTAQAYYAFTPEGIVEGDLVYGFNGLSQDFDVLKEQNITLRGNILLLHSASMSTVRLAYEEGVVGIIIFPNPKWETIVRPEDAYPNSILLPSTGIKRAVFKGGSMNGPFGDVLTPGYPSTVNAYHMPIQNTTFSPIPIQPINFKDGITLMNLLGGAEMPQEWDTASEIENFKIGPEFKDARYRKLRLTVRNTRQVTRVYNVIGTIKGSVEPDRYVIMGNHRDAWSFGAVDPASGTSVLMEVTRVYGELLKEGWRPRRTIVFASWTAEEFGIVGSFEWVEEKLPKLHQRAVTYINTDICVMGDIFRPMASEVLHDAIYEVTSLMPDPNGVAENFYVAWLNQTKYDNQVPEHQKTQNKPYIDGHVLYRSDHAPFHIYASIPYLDLNWGSNDYYLYPAYHTGYDTFHLIDKFLDPTYNLHRACGHVAGLLIHYMADSLLIPFNMTAYLNYIELIVRELENKTLDSYGISLRPMLEAKDELVKSVNNWYKKLEHMDLKNPLIVRMLNDQLMYFERSTTFLRSDPRNIQGTRDIAYTAASDIFDILQYPEFVVFNVTKIEFIKRRISDFSIAVTQAAQTLQSFHLI